ncbi:acyl-CoA thioesterase [Salipiger mucosus]|uniref:Putative 4-hydroxybenzoyl-CoA thioesterase n=1 Tax=Salipiger mucosus DSM 16094 TaxID=1123237 RepID=S9R257_9RHOB|nr:thioesterase family protein [Salipiger mucosus]EPX85977.1 putative 4-hydroxybenzoyl-CoA thioesterase [Salipiger mucosus DSM 16094]
MTRTPPPARDAFVTFCTIPTRWKDNDNYGHINNAEYLSFLDTAISLWQLEHGMDIAAPTSNRYLAADTGCTYFAEARFPDVLHLGLRIGHLGTSSVRYELGVFRNEDPTACAMGHFVHVCVDADSRPVPIPDEDRALFETLQR